MKEKVTTFFIIPLILTIYPLFSQKNIKNIQGNAGKRWAVCIGINDYKDKRIVDLQNARNDAKVLADVLKKNGQFDEVFLFTEEAGPDSENYPKKANVLGKMNSLKSAIKPDDLVLFFFSGHGISTAAGDGFLVLANSYRENLNGTSLKVKDVVKWFSEIGVKKSLLILDAGREKFLQSGATLKGAAMENFGPDAVGAVIYGAKAGGAGYDNTGASLGALAGHVIDGLNGHADKQGNSDGLTSFSELASYIRKGVSQWAASAGKTQEPQIQVGDAYGKLALSAYAGSPARMFKPAGGGAPSAVTAVQLRKTSRELKENDVKALLKKYGFFDKKRNAAGAFKNGFEAKTIGGGKVVVDNATGLMWHATGSDKGMEMSVAQGWLSALNVEKYAGFSDWRIPTLEEAVSLLAASRKNGNLFIEPLFSPRQKNMWTGDTSGKEAGWAVSFERGQVVRDYVFNYFFIRPVREAK
ncbi:MAG: DUF1566 domain-containing protein [bacterium]|nr:DUF1566 domain-containing protein [bacterium]